MAINSVLCSRVKARARESSDGVLLRDVLLRFGELRLRVDLALLEDLAVLLRRLDVLRTVLFVTGEPPVWRL